MLKSRYLLLIVLAFGVMAAGMILGYYGYLYQEMPMYLASYFLFGVGVAIVVWIETRRIDEGMTNNTTSSKKS